MRCAEHACSVLPFGDLPIGIWIPKSGLGSDVCLKLVEDDVDALTCPNHSIVFRQNRRKFQVDHPQFGIERQLEKRRTKHACVDISTERQKCMTVTRAKKKT